MLYQNPVISGFHPDPSVCRVGEDFYLVNSTFEYFPGVPIYHSKNLVNWRLIGHCLTREAQLPLHRCRPSGGIYAPTIRYHDGLFYMTSTNVTGGGNFIVSTGDPGGSWSDPVFIDQEGIDPSLLFDDDGKVYFTSAWMDEAGQAGIYQCEIDPLSGAKCSDTVLISRGAGGRSPEAPHLYKYFGMYYLVLAEGGTEYGHSVTVFRSQAPYGPFTPCPFNPVLTHREDTRGEIDCVGHADFFTDQNGESWLVCLGTRSCSEKDNPVLLHNLGRETFLAPVRWSEDLWPLIGDEGNEGRISLSMDGPLPGPEPTAVRRDFSDDFSSSDFSPQYNFLRNPQMQNYKRDPERKALILQGTEKTLSEQDSPSWIGIRQKDFLTRNTVTIAAAEKVQGMRAGLSAFYNDSYHYEIYLTCQQNQWKVCLAKQVHDIFVCTASADIPRPQNVRLRISSGKRFYRFSYSLNGKDYRELGKGATAGLCTEGSQTMSFTGTYIALFAERSRAVFKDFSSIIRGAGEDAIKS